MTHKLNFTASAVKDFKSLCNLEHKSLSSCFKTITLNWSKFAKIADKDGLRKGDLNPAYMIQWLDGTNYCKDGILGRITTSDTGEKVFKAYETWTPGRVLDYVRRASALHCKSLGM